MFRKAICLVSLIAFDVGSLLSSLFLAYLTGGKKDIE